MCDEPIGIGYLGEYIEDAPLLGEVPPINPMKRTLKVLENTQVVLDSIAPPHVPVTRKLLDVLEAILLFPEGVPNRGIQQLLGLNESQVSGRLYMFKLHKLVERKPHSRHWVATPLARRAKLVAS